MKNSAMQKGIVEMYRNRFVQDKGVGLISRGESECIVFCKKVAPNIFDIKEGFAVMAGTKDFYNDGVCMISHSTKVIFVFDQVQEEK
jgi:hypothetical protein